MSSNQHFTEHSVSNDKVFSQQVAIASLLTQTGQAHHLYEQAILKGVYDQQWPTWYADYALKQGIEHLLERPLTLEQMSQLLQEVNEQYEAENPPISWANYSAQKLLKASE
jgi:hypothetical protein